MMAFVPFLAFVGCSALWAQDPGAVVKEVIRWGDFVLLGIVGAYVFTPESGFDKPPSLLGWIGVIVSVSGITQFLARVNQSPYRPGAGAFFGQPNPTAAFLCLCILPVLGLLAQDRRSHFITRIVVFVVLLLGLAFTFSRGVILACLVGGAYFSRDVVRSHLVRHRRAAVVFTGILVTVACLAGFGRFRATAKARLVTQPPFGERQAIFAFGWSLYQQHPWLGLGAGNLKPYASKFNLRFHEYEPFEPKYGDLHNLYLQLAVETGGIGLILFVAGFVGFTILVARRERFLLYSDKLLYRSLWAASLTYLLANCSGYYTVKGIHLEWAVLLALQIAMTENPLSIHD
jgi:O-antigen ligase